MMFSIIFPLTLIIGICELVFLIKVLRRRKKDGKSNLIVYSIGYGSCIAVNTIIILTLYIDPLYLLFGYIMTFAPLIFFCFMLNKSLIKKTRLDNFFVNIIYKSIVTLLIWGIAFSPFSLPRIMGIANAPARKQEILRMQEEVISLETYADLTPFGMGLYKLHSKGDEYLWDVTKPKDKDNVLITHDGVVLLFDYHSNHRYHNSWDSLHQGVDVTYDVIFYEGTFLIISPLWDTHDRSFYWNLRYVYLCKEMDMDADIFALPLSDPEAIEKLMELPIKQMSRKEIAEILGVVF